MALRPDPSLIPDPLRPFDTTRLSFRAVRQSEDLPLFLAMGHDQDGYMNSNFTNTNLASTADATKYIKCVAEESLLGATIWLRETETQIPNEKARASGNEGSLKSEWGTAIGEIHLSNLQPGAAHHRWTEIGIDILPSFQGRGYGSEAIEWVLDYAFRRRGLHRVRIRAFEWNEGAIRLYEKIGFKREGREREAFWHEGRWWDGIEFSMLEGEWWDMQRGKEKKDNQEGEGRRTSRAIRIESSQ